MHCASSGDRIQGRNSGTCCTCCINKDQWEPSACSRTQTRVPLARWPLTTWHSQAWLLWCHERVDWRVEWHSAVFTDESRFCLYASDGHNMCMAWTWWASSYGVHLPTTLRPHLRLHGVGSISYNSQSHLVFLQGKVNSADYIAQIANPVLLPFTWQAGDVLFQHDNAHPHMAAKTQHAPHGIQQLPWPARSPDLSPIEHVWDTM